MSSTPLWRLSASVSMQIPVIQIGRTVLQAQVFTWRHISILLLNLSLFCLCDLSLTAQGPASQTDLQELISDYFSVKKGKQNKVGQIRKVQNQIRRENQFQQTLQVTLETLAHKRHPTLTAPKQPIPNPGLSPPQRSANHPSSTDIQAGESAIADHVKDRDTSRRQGGIKQAYGIQLEPRAGRSFSDGKRLFQQGNYELASEIIMENRYTADAVNDPYYLNWLLKSLLAARRLEFIPHYLKQFHLQQDVLRESTDERDAELYYLIGRYYFALGNMQKAREIFVDYLYQFQGSYYVPNAYYWIARSLERDNYLEGARTVYLLVVSYFSQHDLQNIARYKASVISLYLLKKQAEDFLRSRGVDWTL